MRLRTSETEIKHLLVAWLAISLAFTILFRPQMLDFFAFFRTFIASALTVGLGVVLHELAHKIVAQRYGSWSEFRAEPLLLFAILMAFAGFVFAAPGAVVIFNPYLTREQSGKIAVAGPLTNVALSFAFLTLSLLTSFFAPAHSFVAEGASCLLYTSPSPRD